MRAISVIALALACSSRAPDDCPAITAKLRPILLEMSSPARADEAIAQFCEAPQTPTDKELRACILQAVGKPAIEGCLASALDGVGGYSGKVAGRLLRARADSETATIDAGVSVPLSAIPELPITDHTHGDEVEVIVVDLRVDALAASLYGLPFVVRATDKPIRGRVVASSKRSAALALFAAGGVTPMSEFAHDFATNELRYFAASELDVLQAVARTMKTNIVARLPGGFAIDAVLTARDALPALEMLDNLVETRADYMIYLLPKGVALPPLPALSAAAPVSIHAPHATARQVSAALAAVSHASHSCAASALQLHLEDVPVEEAERAIAAASGAKLDNAACPLTEATTIDPTKVAAIAISGNQRVAVTTDDKLVRRSDTVSIDLTGVNSTTTAAPPRPETIKTFTEWRKRIVRVAAVIRTGDRWQAWLELRDGTYITLDPGLQTNMPPGLALTPVTIDATGVTIADVTGRRHSIALAAK